MSPRKLVKQPPLPRDFYDRDPVTVAHELLGKYLMRSSAEDVMHGCIVETEAYLAAEDSACHAHRGRTRRNASMFGPPGHAYVYAIHSRWCLNVVTDKLEVACAVLIRAVEPLEGIEQMKIRRGTERALDLARGPGRLCEAFEIDRRLDGWDLTNGDSLWISEPRTAQPFQVGVSPRIGVTSAQELKLRFFMNGSRYVSGPRRFHSAEPTSSDGSIGAERSK